MAGLTDLFADTVRETSETALGGNKGYLNLVQAARYTNNFLIGGKTEEELLHTGQTIRRTLYLSPENVGKRFGGAGLRFNWENRQIGTKVTTQMSFYANYLAWDELELDLNADSTMGKEYIRAKFNDILRGKFQNLAQTTATQFENENWAPGNQAAMRTNFTAPMSIPYYITEQDDFIPLDSTGAALSDVLGLSPVTYPNFANQRVTYSTVGGDAPDGSDMVGALLHASNLATFEPLPMNPEHGVDATAPNVVFCSDSGLRYLTGSFRQGQDRWGSRELGYGMVLGNMYFHNISALGSALLYEPNGGGALVAETTASTGGVSGATGVTGPRFYGVTKNVMQPLFMRDRYMEPGEVTNLTSAGAPNEYVQVFKTYNQLVCCDRSKLFIVSPSAAL